MRRARGQAIVELSLVLTLLTAVIVGGLYFYEALRGTLLTQQANTAMIWESTGYSDRVTHASATANCPQLLDAAAGRFGATADRQGLFTQAQPIALRCASVRDPAPTCKGNTLTSAQRPVIKKENRFTFQASSVQRTFGPTGFLLGQQTWSASGLPLCGLGLPFQGQCELAYHFISEDWHVEDDRDCRLGGCANLEFHAAARSLFAPGSGAASRLAEFTAGESPVDETKFWVSRTDLRTGYVDPDTPMGDVRRDVYETGPGPAARQECYLGLPCP